MTASAPLKLVAFDADDLAVISAHLQDAALDAGDVVWLADEKRFVLVVTRFDRSAAQTGERRRCRTGLHFERVLSVRRTHFDPKAKTMPHLLAIAFAATDAPAGHVTLGFSDGAAIRLEVECLEAAMSDLGPSWSVGATADRVA